MNYIGAFLVGGIICAIGQIIMDKSNLTPAKVLVLFVVSGNILGLLGIYDYIVKIGHQGATIPLPGFGYALYNGVVKEVAESGFIGIFSGGLKATALGIGSVLAFSFVASIIFEPKSK